MGDMQMPPTDWFSPQGLFVLGMWLTMMQAMMLPAALPMILLYRRCVLRDRQRTARLWLFCAAYVLVWSGFALLLSGLQALGEHVGVLDPMRLRLPPALGGLVLLVLAEKLLPLGEGWRRCSGALLIAAGLLLLFWARS